MTGSRTIKVLVCLVIAMTAGAFTLRMLETRPSPISITDLIALDRTTDYQTDVPLAARIWKNIVVHSTPPERADLAKRSHFVIDEDGATLVHATDLWKKQVAGNHVTSSSRGKNYNETSIGICLKGDFSKQPPNEKQFHALINLVRNLQQLCDIQAQNVYLYGPDLNNSQYSPGKAFPTKNFWSQLIRTR